MIGKYINFNRIVEDMIRNREDNQAALRSLIEQQAELLADDGVGAIQYDKEPVQSSPVDDVLVDIAIERELVADRIRELQIERRVFDIAWDRLSAEERQVLEIFYQQGMSRQDAVDLLCEQFHCEKTKVYTMKSRAISRLKRLLFG